MGTTILKNGRIMYRYTCPICGCEYAAGREQVRQATCKYWRVKDYKDLQAYSSHHIECPCCKDLTREDLAKPQRMTLTEIDKLS